MDHRFHVLYCAQDLVYLIPVRDAHSRRVFGYALDTVMTTTVLIRAMNMAIASRDFIPHTAVLHTVRARQFTLKQLRGFMGTFGEHLSMGCTGVCWDDIMVESF